MWRSKSEEEEEEGITKSRKSSKVPSPSPLTEVDQSHYLVLDNNSTATGRAEEVTHLDIGSFENTFKWLSFNTGTIDRILTKGTVVR